MLSPFLREFDIRAETLKQFVHKNHLKRKKEVILSLRCCRKPDPAGGENIIKESIPISITKNPFMLLVFTSKPALRDYILSKLPINPRNREEFVFSSDFIEFLNVLKPEEWGEVVFVDEIGEVS